MKYGVVRPFRRISPTYMSSGNIHFGESDSAGSAERAAQLITLGCSKRDGRVSLAGFLRTASESLIEQTHPIRG